MLVAALALVLGRAAGDSEPRLRRCVRGLLRAQSTADAASFSTQPPSFTPLLTTAAPTEDHHREMEDLLNNEVVQRVLKDPELGDLLKHADNHSSRASPGVSLSTIQTTLLNSSVLRALLTDGPLIQRIANVQTVLPVSESTESSRVT